MQKFSVGVKRQSRRGEDPCLIALLFIVKGYLYMVSLRWYLHIPPIRDRCAIRGVHTIAIKHDDIWYRQMKFTSVTRSPKLEGWDFLSL